MRRSSFFDWRWGDSSRFFSEADWLLGETDWPSPQFEPSSATSSGSGASADRVNPNPAPTGIIDSFLDSDELLLPPQFQQGGGTGSGTGAMTPSLASETITYAGSGLVFVNTYGSGVSTTFRNEIVAAENYFQSHFTNSCTIRCSFDLQSLSAGVSGENSFYAVAVSYSTSSTRWRAMPHRRTILRRWPPCRDCPIRPAGMALSFRWAKHAYWDWPALAPASTTMWCSTASTGRPAPCRTPRTTPQT
jgi:hypothetical protein